ncbi:MAG: amidohydrolase family protein [Pirellulaceae bacterium]
MLRRKTTSRRSPRTKTLRIETLEQRAMLAADGIADTIFTNGKIYTVDPNTSWHTSAAQAIAIDDDQILAVGTNAQVLALKAPGTVVLDLEGRTVMPGFHDVHTHILEAFSSVNTVQLTPETPLRDLLPSLVNQQPHPATGWVLGGGQTIDQFFNLNELPKDILDEAIPNVPAAMLEATSHSMWVNSAALAAAGIDLSTQDPPGGIIVRDDSTGEATGLLIDNAVDLIFEVALAQNNQLDELNYQGLLEGLETFNQLGVTSVGDARVYTSRGHDDVWKRAEAEDTLTVRANLGLWAYPQADDEQQLADLASLYSNDPNNLVKINEIKIYSDGITENGTASFFDDYQTIGYASSNGLKYFETDRLEVYIVNLEKIGFTFNIHAIGDQGVSDALTAIESAALINASTVSGQRHRLTHIENVHPDDISRFNSLGVIADFQVGGDILDPDNREFLRTLIGDRADSILPVRSIFDTGATVVLSSDFDVNPASPFVGIEKSLTRTDGQKMPSVKDAVEAYTINAAYAMNQDDLVGSLTVGKLADLVVLDQDLFAIAQTDIDNTQAVMTLLGGQSVHGGALALKSEKESILESTDSTTFTISRQSNTGDLLVSLSSSDTSEATVPATVTIPDGQTSVTFRVSAVDDVQLDATQNVTIKATAAGLISSIAMIGIVDDDPQGSDFGDAPSAGQSGFFSSYPVTTLQNGAIHKIGPLYLGNAVDAELFGQPSAAANSDDSSGTDDEDGVNLSTTWVVQSGVSTNSSVSIVASVAGKLDAWVDLNRDGDWEDLGEKIIDSVSVVAGANNISVVIPAGTSAGETAARFRLSTAGGLSPTGGALDGEVEDEWFTLETGGVALNAAVYAAVPSQPTGPVIVSTENGRTVVRYQTTEFFGAGSSSFGSLTVNGGPHNETFVVNVGILSRPVRGLAIHGGGGTNELRISGDGLVSLVDGSFNAANIGVIDMRSDGATRLQINDFAIRSLSSNNRVKILGGPTDKVVFADAANWRFADPTTQNGVFIRTIRNVVSGMNEAIEIDTPFAWHNNILAEDVDNNGEVTPNDILEVINQLVDRRYIQSGSETAVSPSQVSPWPNRYYDTSGNNEFTPNDILVVINYLAEQRANTPSGEQIVKVSASDFMRTNRDRRTNDDLETFASTIVFSDLPRVVDFEIPHENDPPTNVLQDQVLAESSTEQPSVTDLDQGISLLVNKTSDSVSTN